MVQYQLKGFNMASRKKLPLEAYGVKIISDCGVGKLKPNSKTNVRLAMVECPECKAHRKVNIYPLINKGEGKLCPSCSNSGSRNGAFKHGEYGSRANLIWNSMRQRCNNPKATDYGSYGARGIRVCTEWDDFRAFEHFIDGRLDKDDASLERVDVDGNYDPSNIIIIPTYLQAVTRRNSMGIVKACEFAKDIIENGKHGRGYIMYYMNKYDLEDYQVKQFVNHNKHHKELSELNYG